jgi:hypothetical protein
MSLSACLSTFVERLPCCQVVVLGDTRNPDGIGRFAEDADVRLLLRAVG